MDNKQNKFLINTDFYSFPILNELSWMKLESMLIFKGQTKIVHILDRRNPTLYYVLQYSKSSDGTFDLSKAIPRGHCFGLGESEYDELILFPDESQSPGQVSAGCYIPCGWCLKLWYEQQVRIFPISICRMAYFGREFFPTSHQCSKPGQAENKLRRSW